MNEDLLFRQLFVAIYIVFAGVRMRYRISSAKRELEQRHQAPGIAMILLTIAILGYFSSIFLDLFFPHWLSWSRIMIPSWLRWLGVIVALCSTLLVDWIHRELGRQYSAELAIQKEHSLVTTGPYARTRHPMYTALNMFSFSTALTTSNSLILLFAILVIIPFPWIARAEEEMLLETFGEEYREYMKRTGRFFPLIRSKSD